MDEADTAVAFARVKQWVGARLLVRPTDFALYFGASILRIGINDTTVNFNGFFSIELVFTLI